MRRRPLGAAAGGNERNKRAASTSGPSVATSATGAHLASVEQVGGGAPGGGNRRARIHTMWARLLELAKERHRWAMRGLAFKMSGDMPKRLDTRPPRGLTIQGARWGGRELGTHW